MGLTPRSGIFVPHHHRSNEIINGHTDNVLATQQRTAAQLKPNLFAKWTADCCRLQPVLDSMSQLYYHDNGEWRTHSQSHFVRLHPGFSHILDFSSIIVFGVSARSHAHYRLFMKFIEVVALIFTHIHRQSEDILTQTKLCHDESFIFGLNAAFNMVPFGALWKRDKINTHSLYRTRSSGNCA